MGTLAGLGVGGAVGGIVGALVGMGIPEFEAKRYEGAVKDGGTLLSVHCDTSEQISAAKDALKESGARDISSTGEASSGHTSGAHHTFGDLSNDETAGATPGYRDENLGVDRGLTGNRVAGSSNVLNDREPVTNRDAVTTENELAGTKTSSTRY